MKTCNKCEATLPTSAFGARRTNRDGLNSVCLECVSKYNRARRAWIKTNGPVPKGTCPCGAVTHIQNTYGLCPTCSKPARNRKYYERNKTVVAESNKRYKLNNPEKVRAAALRPDTRVSRARWVAKKRGLEWGLDESTYAELIARGCHYCAADLMESPAGCLDRIDNNRGYTSDNVLPCCWECNTTRMDHYTVEETEVMISALKVFRNKQA